MDRTQDCGSCNRGSIPRGGTENTKSGLVPGFVFWSKESKPMRDGFGAKRTKISALGTEHVMFDSSRAHKPIESPDAYVRAFVM